MPQPLKILQLMPRFCFPEDDGGKIGMANIFKQFSAQADKVTLFSFEENKIPDEWLSFAESLGKVRIYRHSIRNNPGRIFLSMLRNESVYLMKHINPKIKAYAEQLVKEADFNVIHVDHTAMAPLGFYIKMLKNVPLGIRMHNIEWKIWSRYGQRLPFYHPGKYYIKRQANLLKRKEKEYFEAADACFAITELDKKESSIFAPEANILVAGAGVDAKLWQPDDSIEKNPYELILATTYHWRHNIDAVDWFIDEVFTKIKREIPQAVLTLIGKDAPKRLYEYHSIGVNVIGYVPDVKPYMNRAQLYVAPLFVGGGVRIKIIEAMAMKLPVVATPIAAEGIQASESDGLIIRRDAKSYSQAIIHLLKDPEYIKKYGKAARHFALNNFSWESSVKVMTDEYRRLLQ